MDGRDAPDLRYRMPARTKNHEKTVGADPEPGVVVMYFDENISSLTMRIGWKRARPGPRCRPHAHVASSAMST